ERPIGTGLMAIAGAAEPPDVTKAEVKMAAKKISARKAPGMDGVPGMAVKIAALNVPTIFTLTFSACLKEGCFPAQWKEQRLVLLSKGNRPPDDPSSFRPLCMLDISGKLYERVICARLEAAIENAGFFPKTSSDFG
ncbi:hypothetical protein DD595_26090, partial [Enterobacter cloacae complex sp. 4DZ3-17B2]